MTLTPYLHFEGQAEEALNFYKNIFNGEITMTSRYGDAPMPVDDDWKNKLMHARLKLATARSICLTDLKVIKVPKMAISSYQLMYLMKIRSKNCSIKWLKAGR